MTRTQLLRVLALVSVAVMVAIPIIRACAPEGPSLAFTWATHPDYPLNAYADGKMGILQPTYARSYLVVAYRQLTGAPLTQAERRSALELWNFRLKGGVLLSGIPRTTADEDISDAPDWKITRAEYIHEPAPDPVRFRWDEDFYRPEVSDSALGVAAATLQDRAKRWKKDLITEWIRTQDKVFAANGKTKSIPDPARPNQDALFQKDRAYQIACAHFYVGEFAASRSAFSVIAQDGASPWRRLSAYLVGRCWFREGERLLSKDATGAVRCFQEAHKVFNALQQGGLPPRPVTQAPDPIGEEELAQAIHVSEQRSLAAADPEAAAHMMAQELKKRGASKDFGDLMARYTNLLDANITGESDSYQDKEKPRSILPGLLKDDLTEWAFRFRETGPKAYSLAYQRWKGRRSHPWLLMALMNAEPSSKGVEEVLVAASTIPADNPGFESYAFHRARILAAQGKESDAKAIIATFLDGDAKNTTASSQNLWRALRMPLAQDANSFLADLLRIPAGSYGLYYDEKGKVPSLNTAYSGIQASHPEIRQMLKGVQAPPRFIEGDGARVLNLQTPSEVLLDLARKPELPSHLRREWTRAVWVRAVLLERWDVAANATPDLLDLEPELKDSLGGFASATPEEQSRQALMALLRHPGLRWMVFQGINHRTFTEPGEKPLPLRHRDTFLGACWWPGPWGNPIDADVAADYYWWGSSFYYPKPHVLEQPLHSLVGTGPLPVPWLNQDQRGRGTEEGRRLVALDDAPDWLAAHALAWAEAAPEDPRIPEALHHAVRTGKVGGKKHFDRKCFRLLHTRYKQSPWAAKTPIHY